MFSEIKPREKIHSNRGYQYRFYSDPKNNQKRRIKRNSIKKEVEEKKKIMAIIVPLKVNFFKATFNPSKYIWVVYHKTINDESQQNQDLLLRLKEAFKHLEFTEENLPVCSSVAELKKFTMQKYQLKVAIDRSIETDLRQFDQIVMKRNVICVSIVGEMSANFAMHIGRSIYSSKIYQVEKAYDRIISTIARDSERIKLYLKNEEESNLKNMRNFVLPNFTFINIQQKTKNQTYRNNLLCLINLHKDEVDIGLLRDKFISECRQNEQDDESKKLMDEYQSVPMTYKDRLNLYTRKSFFYIYLNNALRMAESTDQFYVIGEPFNCLFRAIQHYYHEQKWDKSPRSHLKLYRGTRILESEYKLLQGSIGQYIQIQGFISTSLDQQEAKKFANLIEIGQRVIFQFVFDDVTTTDEDILSNDYGFADLRSISNFQEKQFLINALNIFKLMSIGKRDELVFITLKYGKMINLLSIQEDKVKQLNNNDQIAYQTYKESIANKSTYDDIGQINKFTDTHRSVFYYEAKVHQYESTANLKEGSLIKMELKLAEAYNRNDQPHKSVALLEKVQAKKDNIRTSENNKHFFDDKIAQSSNEQDLNIELKLGIDICLAKAKIDQFGGAEEQLKMIEQAIITHLKLKESCSLWKPKLLLQLIELIFQKAEIKRQMEHFIQAKQIFSLVEEKLKSFITKITGRETKKYRLLIIKALQLKARVIFELSMLNQNMDKQKVIELSDLLSRFKQNQQAFNNIVGKMSKDSIVHFSSNIQQSQSDQNQQRQNLLISEGLPEGKPNKIQNQPPIMSPFMMIYPRDIKQQICMNFHRFAALQWNKKSSKKQQQYIKGLKNQHTQYIRTYGANNPNTLKIGLQLAQMYIKIKKPQLAIDILQIQVKEVPYENMNDHTILGKTEYMLGLSYLDMGEFGQAHNYFLSALKIYSALKKSDFQRYGPRYKVELQLGRTYTFMGAFEKSEQKFNLCEAFATKQTIQSDLAEIKSQKSILYMRWGKFKQSKQQIQMATQLFAKTKGTDSPQYAKCKCTSALVESKFGNSSSRQTIMNYLRKADAIYNNYYTHINNDRIHCMSYKMYFITGQIQKKFRSYEQAIKCYKTSIRLQDKFDGLKEEQISIISSSRDNLQNLASTFNRFVNPIKIKTKKRIHELTCRANIIECEFRYGKKQFEQIQKDLVELIAEIERELNKKKVFINRDGQNIQVKGSTMEQLKCTCLKIQSKSSSYKEKRKKKLENIQRKLSTKQTNTEAVNQQIRNSRSSTD